MSTQKEKLKDRLSRCFQSRWSRRGENAVIIGQLQKQCESNPRGLPPPAAPIAMGNSELIVALQFLNQVTGGDVELQKFLQRMVGYCLTGVTNTQSKLYRLCSPARASAASAPRSAPPRPCERSERAARLIATYTFWHD
jgi:hypothetical protein